MSKIIVPDVNLSIYQHFYVLENTLREFIIANLASLHGPRWYKKCLSEAALDKFKFGIQYEQKKKWTATYIFHPIHYLDFPYLREIIIRNDNWKNVFQGICYDRDILSATLLELEPIRNRMAHNRICTASDLTIVESAKIKLENLIGKKLTIFYNARQTTVSRLDNILYDLTQEAVLLHECCLAFKPISDTPIWHLTRMAWWFDSLFLDQDLSPVTTYFSLVESYMTFPRQRGDGIKLEKWYKLARFENHFTAAMQTLSEITPPRSIDNGT